MSFKKNLEKIRLISHQKCLGVLKAYIVNDEKLIAKVRGFTSERGNPCILALTDTRLIRVRKKAIGEEVISLPIGSITTIDETTSLGSHRMDFYFINGRISFYPSGRKEDVEDLQILKSQLRRILKPDDKQLDSQGQPDIYEQIRKLAELHKDKIITDLEFKTKKTELLSKM